MNFTTTRKILNKILLFILTLLQKKYEFNTTLLFVKKDVFELAQIQTNNLLVEFIE